MKNLCSVPQKYSTSSSCAITSASQISQKRRPAAAKSVIISLHLQRCVVGVSLRCRVVVVAEDSTFFFFFPAVDAELLLLFLRFEDGNCRHHHHCHHQRCHTECDPRNGPVSPAPSVDHQHSLGHLNYAASNPLY